MKTRKKVTDTRKLLGLSSRSKPIPNRSKELSSIKKYERRSSSSSSSSSVDVSDKENVSSKKQTKDVGPLRQNILSPLKELSERVVLSPLNPPEATSTPNIVRRTLFPVAVAALNVSEDDDLIILSDSDCTDTELEGLEAIDQNKENVVKKRKPRAKKVPSNEPPVELFTNKRHIRPTFKALNSPSHRSFFEKPREVPSTEKMPSEVPINVEIPAKNPPRKPRAPNKKADADAQSMPAPVVPAKRVRKAGKRVVRLYSEPKPVPKDGHIIPKYRQELEKQNEAAHLEREGSAVDDDDIYNFHPSQESVDELEKDDSYIKALIEKLKKRKPRKKKITSRKELETLVSEIQGSSKKNKAETVIERIRQRLSESPSARKSTGPEKSVTFDIPEVSMNVPLAQSPLNKSLVMSPINRNTSMLPPSSPLINSPSFNRSILLPPIISPNISRVIRDPVPGTSTGGWTPSGNFRQHSTPNQRLSRSVAESSVNRSINSPQSPWRVNDEARVSRTKYFSLSKDMLPSYSSDVIVREEIPYVPDREKDSFNNSNAENEGPRERRPPVTKVLPTKRVPLGALEVADLHPMTEKHKPVTQSPLIRHSLTPRQLEKQTQKKRTQIQIISDVPVTGPGYRLSNDRLVCNNPEIIDENSNDSICSANSNVSECFGFDVSSMADDEDDENVSHAISERELKEKLKNLKKVFPLEKSVSQDIDMPVLFKSPMKQMNTLKTMFEGGTPGSRKKKKKEDEPEPIVDSSDSEIEEPSKDGKERDGGEENEENITITLFDDPEPLRVKQIPIAKRRSYACRQKRKRLHYSDYDTDSESETHDEDASDKHKHKRRKREKPNVEKSEEFQQFVSDFNSMCDEVEKYELVVEPIE